MNQYSMLIQWSEEDQLFLVTIPEFSDRVIMQISNAIARSVNNRLIFKFIDFPRTPIKFNAIAIF